MSKLQSVNRYIFLSFDATGNAQASVSVPFACKEILVKSIMLSTDQTYIQVVVQML
jgi:hypothetical protein